jgi:hypothetical protein
MADTRSRLTELPADPFTALSVHFGMLLGVSDIELLAANPRGKLRLHNAWLHGPGVVWGYRVSFQTASRELWVDPGLALDSLGRELNLGARLCLDLDKWYEANRDRLGDGDVVLDVTVRHRACLDRPVPAVMGECDDSPESAYSRVQETVQVDLEEPVDRPPTTFLRLRAALGQIAGPVEDAALAELVALDSLDLELPEDDPPVVVARVTVAVQNGRPDIADDAIDHGIRRVHIPTMLLTELLAAHAPAGPHLDEGDVRWDDDQHMSIGVGAPLHEPTLAGNVAAHRWDADHWAVLDVTPSFAGGRLVLDLGEAIAAGTLVRVVVSGSGPTPVTADVGGRPVPLAGDVVLTIERS